jgi:hypothetical protein
VDLEGRGIGNALLQGSEALIGMDDCRNAQ